MAIETFVVNGNEFYSDDTFTLALVGADDPETTPEQIAKLLGRNGVLELLRQVRRGSNEYTKLTSAFGLLEKRAARVAENCRRSS